MASSALQAAHGGASDHYSPPHAAGRWWCGGLHALRCTDAQAERHHRQAIAIALTATPAVEQTLRGDPERLKRTLEKYIVRRPGRPEDIANMVQFLASDASSWITGQVYPVNGGFSFAV